MRWDAIWPFGWKAIAVGIAVFVIGSWAYCHRFRKDKEPTGYLARLCCCSFHFSSSRPHTDYPHHDDYLRQNDCSAHTNMARALYSEGNHKDAHGPHADQGAGIDFPA